MATFKNYDPDGVLVVFNKIPMFGFAPGTFVRVERDEDTFSEVAGAGRMRRSLERQDADRA